jgi:hypothetical protein
MTLLIGLSRLLQYVPPGSHMDGLRHSFLAWRYALSVDKEAKGTYHLCGTWSCRAISVLRYGCSRRFGLMKEEGNRGDFQSPLEFCCTVHSSQGWNPFYEQPPTVWGRLNIIWFFHIHKPAHLIIDAGPSLVLLSTLTAYCPSVYLTAKSSDAETARSSFALEGLLDLGHSIKIS